MQFFFRIDRRYGLFVSATSTLSIFHLSASNSKTEWENNVKRQVENWTWMPLLNAVCSGITSNGFNTTLKASTKKHSQSICSSWRKWKMKWWRKNRLPGKKDENTNVRMRDKCGLKVDTMTFITYRLSTGLYTLAASTLFPCYFCSNRFCRTEEWNETCGSNP